MSRLFRRFAAILAMGAFAFAQLAVSAYACSSDSSAGVTIAAAGGGAVHCDKMDTANLCDRHCDYGASTMQHAVVDSLPPFAAVALPWRIDGDAAVEPAQFARARGLTAAHSPPPLVLFGILRI